MMQVERVLKGLKADESIASDIRSVVCQILRHYRRDGVDHVRPRFLANHHPAPIVSSFISVDN